MNTEGYAHLVAKQHRSDGLRQDVALQIVLRVHMSAVEPGFHRGAGVDWPTMSPNRASCAIARPPDRTMPSLISPLTAPIRRWVMDAFPRGQSGIDYDHPIGDPGWFGPDSVTWRVHAELPSMLAGGLCALMLQALHPRALAGVYDHSNFREDLVGRLRRTTAFVAGTTYAPAAEVDTLVARVRRIHSGVRGSVEGVPYAADDPQLLTWVHVTEAYGFLQGFRRYGRAMPEAMVDRYYNEFRRVAEALGAQDVPRSAADVDAFFAMQRPHLRLDARAREVLQVLSAVKLPVPVAGLSRDVFMGAGAALLPEWASELLEHGRRQRVQAQASMRLLQGAAPLFRRALPDGLASRACARVGVEVAQLRRWPARL